MVERIPMSEHGHLQLKKELEQLEKVERHEVVKAIEIARAHGDFLDLLFLDLLGQVGGKTDRLGGHADVVGHVLDEGVLAGELLGRHAGVGAQVDLVLAAFEDQVVGEGLAGLLEGGVDPDPVRR